MQLSRCRRCLLHFTPRPPRCRQWLGPLSNASLLPPHASTSCIRGHVRLTDRRESAIVLSQLRVTRCALVAAADHCSLLSSEGMRGGFAHVCVHPKLPINVSSVSACFAPSVHRLCVHRLCTALWQRVARARSRLLYSLLSGCRQEMLCCRDACEQLACMRAATDAHHPLERSASTHSQTDMESALFPVPDRFLCHTWTRAHCLAMNADASHSDEHEEDRGRKGATGSGNSRICPAIWFDSGLLSFLSLFVLSPCTHAHPHTWTHAGCRQERDNGQTSGRREDDEEQDKGAETRVPRSPMFPAFLADCPCAN